MTNNSKIWGWEQEDLQSWLSGQPMQCGELQA